MRMISPMAPPTPAPIPIALVLLGADWFVSAGVGAGALVEAPVEALSETVKDVAVGPEIDVLMLDVDDDVDVVLALVLAPTTAP